MKVMYMYHLPSQVVTGKVINKFNRNWVKFYTVELDDGAIITRQAKSFQVR